MVYAIATEQNIAKLFMAALIPGLMAVLFYAVRHCHRRQTAIPSIAPVLARVGMALSAAGAWLLTLPAIVVLTLVIGGIYGGVFTPTEAAAVGTVAMLVIGLLQRRLGWREIMDSHAPDGGDRRHDLHHPARRGGVRRLPRALASCRHAAAELVAQSGLPPYAIMAVLMLFYILLGAVMDELAMILLTLPVFFPIVRALDFGIPPDEVGDLVRHSGADRGRHRPDGAADRPQCVRGVGSIAKDVPIHKTYRAHAAVHRRRYRQDWAAHRVSRVSRYGSCAC